MDNAIKTPNRTGILVRALIVLAMCGIVNSAAVFVSPMAKHFGWTTEAIAGVATYMAFMQTPGHILSGWLLGKIGAKKTLILGCILLGLAFLLSGMVPSGSPWMLYITFSVLQGLGVGFTYTGSTYCATGWYPDALVPLETIVEYGENPIAAGQNQGVYITFNVPTTQAPGTYTGSGTVDAPIAHCPDSTVKRCVDPAGVRAVTHWKALGQ